MSKKAETEREWRLRLLEAVLPHVLFDGWSRKAMKAGAADLGEDIERLDLAFPDGATDMIRLFIENADDEMEAELQKQGVLSLKIRERITLAIKVRLELYAEHKEAVRRAVNILALPQNAALALKLTANTVSRVWWATGDTSADYNWYTKRLTLSAVYGATLLYWLADKSAGHQKTWEFLDRRIENVMQIETAKFKCREKLKQKPDFSHLPSAKRFWRNLTER
ncbi:COQ9 family protein [Sneathiella litorea]|uniref:COQ9 family protein n=1 Tax=Sneathiella litorea TaxID=2606216 RepID=A0A6L8WC49_9PROT|nr:COQ9 family protein [Sneathiella litorea]MZR31993.1 COQ9 family protein [Sneathiella litorea]